MESMHDLTFGSFDIFFHTFEWKTDGADELIELDPFPHLEQCDVVVVRSSLEPRMNEEREQGPLDLFSLGLESVVVAEF